MKVTKRVGAAFATAVASLYTTASALLDKASLDKIAVQQYALNRKLPQLEQSISDNNDLLKFAYSPDYGTVFDAPSTTIDVVRSSGQVESMPAPTFFVRYAWGKLGDLGNIKEIIFKESHCPLPSNSCQEKWSVQQLQDFLNYWSGHLKQYGRNVISHYGQANAVQSQLASLQTERTDIVSHLTNLSNQAAQASNSLDMKIYLGIGLIAMEAAIVSYPLWGWKLRNYVRSFEFYKRLRGKIEGHSKTMARKLARKMNNKNLEEGMFNFPFS